jgi:hypothetical protein
MYAVQLKSQPDPTGTRLPEQSHIRSYRERIAIAIRRELGDFALAALAICAIRSIRIEGWQRRVAAGEEIHHEEEPIIDGWICRVSRV